MSQQINLYNPVFRRQQTSFSLLLMLKILAVILAGALLFYGYVLYRVSALGKQIEQSTLQLTEKQAQLTGFGFSPQQARASVKIELLQLEKKTSDTNQLVENLRNAGADNTAGYSGYMRAFSRQVMPGLWLTGFKVSGAQISLSGGASSPDLVPKYIGKLGREDVMQGNSFSILQIQPDKDSKSFDFTVYALRDVEVQP
ncbi:MAG: PilN domain-containing protein [Gallionella sp.]|jgi:Tfp pilus assembly protein PilN